MDFSNAAILRRCRRFRLLRGSGERRARDSFAMQGLEFLGREARSATGLDLGLGLGRGRITRLVRIIESRPLVLDQWLVTLTRATDQIIGST